MAIFVYADESGVFDAAHNDYFVFGGVIFLDKESRDIASRKYLHAERALGAKAMRTPQGELKACTLSAKHKSGLFRSLNGELRFSVTVEQARVIPQIYGNKKSKQRYLDYVFKIGLKNAIIKLLEQGRISSDYDGAIHVRMDEHTTATDGRYELREGLEAEFKCGTYNGAWNRYFPPVLPQLRKIEVDLIDSRKDPLIRAADIVANRAFYHANKKTLDVIQHKIIVKRLP